MKVHFKRNKKWNLYCRGKAIYAEIALKGLKKIKGFSKAILLLKYPISFAYTCHYKISNILTQV